LTDHDHDHERLKKLRARVHRLEARFSQFEKNVIRAIELLHQEQQVKKAAVVQRKKP